jgi:hypothetical protein
MMGYTKDQFEDAVRYFGEVWFVLDSDREYEVHGERDYEFVEHDGHTYVKTEGMKEDEYIDVRFPLDAIEHHYSHREV